MDSTSGSCKRNPMLDLENIIPIDFKSLQQVPNNYKWAHEKLEANHSFGADTVPVIDLSKPVELALIRKTCQEWGVFQVINHGIDLNFLRDLEAQILQFFSLPTDLKRSVARSEGIIGYGTPPISHFFPEKMWSEGFTMVGSPEEHIKRLSPYFDHIKFSNAMVEYQNKVKILANRVIDMVLSSLGLSLEDLNFYEPKTGGLRGNTLLRINYYPPCPDPEKAVGLATHTDASLVTVLYQGIIGGLQTYREDFGWVPVHSVEHALVVNIGDLLHILLNAQFMSPLHRAVLVSSNHHRISAACFVGPPENIKLSPLPKLVDCDHPPRYRSLTWKEFLDAKAVHFNKIFQSIESNSDAL